MRTFTLRILIGAICLSITGVGCGEPAQADSEYDLPENAEGIIDSQDIADMEAEGLTINDGQSPPDITGAYVTGSTEAVYDDDENQIGNTFQDYRWEFEADDDTNEVEVSNESLESNLGSEGMGAYIAGEGDCFTLFSELEGHDNNCSYIQIQLLSGCHSSAGIEDFEFGFIITEYLSPKEDCEGVVVPPGHRRIIREMDGLAERAN